MKRSWSDECAARDAITRLAARHPMFGLDVRWTGVRESDRFEVERIYPNAYLVGIGYPDRFWISPGGNPA